MTKTLYLMRHGQGYHSIKEDGHNIRDPQLTPLGEEQCRRRCESFAWHDQIDLLLASPLRRTLKTCELTFAPCISRGLGIIALPMAEEATADLSDTGSAVDELVKEHPHVNFDHVKDEWFVHQGEYATAPAAVKARAIKLRRWIRDRPEHEAALVAHGRFNHYLCGEVSDSGEQTTPDWHETELRIFTFLDDDEATIKETAESLKCREAGSDKPAV